MKVYVVEKFDRFEEQTDIVGVYSTEAAARLVAGEDGMVTEAEVDSAEPPRELPDPPKRYWWDTPVKP